MVCDCADGLSVTCSSVRPARMCSRRANSPPLKRCSQSLLKSGLLRDKVSTSARQRLGQQAEDVAAHDGAHLLLGEALFEQRGGDLDDAGRVEGLRDRAVEVRAER